MRGMLRIFTMWREIAVAVVATSAIATGAVAFVTRDIREAVDDVAKHQQRSDSLQVVVLRSMAQRDSVWRASMTDVVDLIAVAMTEPAMRRDAALEQLRSRRRVRVGD